MVKERGLVKKKHEGRRYSIKEGIFAHSKLAFGDYYVSPFAIAINSSNSIVAMLSSIVGFLGPLSQIFGSRLIEKSSRKKVLLKTVFFESLAWLSFVAIAVLFYNGIFVQGLPFLLLLAFAFITFFAHLGHPAFFSWVGDLVDKEYRGRWFAKRMMITGFVSIILAILISFFLDYFKKQGWIMFGFMILFSIAFLLRFFCVSLFKKQYEPKIKLKKGYYFSFWDFIINAPKNNFGKFAIFRAVYAFAITISSSLIAVYLLRNLGFSYKMYIVITLAGALLSLFVLQLWGKFADKYGNYRLFAISCIATSITPILWILFKSPFYLILVPSTLGGIFVAAFGLSSGNFIYDNVDSQKRGIVVSYFNMLTGIGVLFGASVGAFLIKFVETSFIEPIVLIFIIGGIIRILVVAIGLPLIREVRETEKVGGFRGFEDIILKEAKPTLVEDVHEIMSIKGYIGMK